MATTISDTRYTVKAPLTDSSYERTALSNGQFFGHRFNSYKFVKKAISIEQYTLLNGHGQQFFPLFENKAPLGGRGSSQSPSARASRLVLHASKFFELLLLVYDLLSW
jgi:hypothetical protein